MMTTEDRDRLIRVDERVSALYKEVCGNGQPGIKQEVAALQRWKSRITGGLALLTFIVVSAITWAARLIR